MDPVPALTLLPFVLLPLAGLGHVLSPQDPPPAAEGSPEERAAAILAAMRAGLGLPTEPGPPAPLHSEGRVDWIGLTEASTLVEDRGALGAFRSRTHYASFGDFELGCDGSFTWQGGPLGPDMHPEVRQGWRASQLVRSMEIPRNTAWQLLYSEARLAGREELNGVPCHVLHLTPRPVCPPQEADEPPPSKPDVWWVTVEEPRLVRARIEGLSEPAVIRLDLDDWRSVEGVRYPHRVLTEVSDFTVETTYERLEPRGPYPADAFLPSEKVRETLARQRDGSEAARDRAIVVEELEARPIASVRTTLPHDQLQRGLAVLLPEVMKVVLSQGVPMDGPPLVRYHSFSEGAEVDLEAAFPVRTPIRPEGRVEPCELPAGRAAVAWHLGPYEKLREAYERLQAFFETEGLEPAGPPWEEYWTDPGLEPDPAKWRTRVVWPVRER